MPEPRKCLFGVLLLPAAAALLPARGVGGPAPPPRLLRATPLPLLGRLDVGAQAHVRYLVEAEEVGQEGAAFEHVRLQHCGGGGGQRAVCRQRPSLRVDSLHIDLPPLAAILVVEPGAYGRLVLFGEILGEVEHKRVQLL
eukprot:scaffold82237_cov63-Phaeocystis_antarctica.AAC.1